MVGLGIKTWKQCSLVVSKFFLSWMATWGSPTPKPSRVWGTWPVPQNNSPSFAALSCAIASQSECNAKFRLWSSYLWQSITVLKYDINLPWSSTGASLCAEGVDVKAPETVDKASSLKAQGRIQTLEGYSQEEKGWWLCISVDALNSNDQVSQCSVHMGEVIIISDWSDFVLQGPEAQI